jgi:hypothetical protein
MTREWQLFWIIFFAIAIPAAIWIWFVHNINAYYRDLNNRRLQGLQVYV